MARFTRFKGVQSKFPIQGEDFNSGSLLFSLKGKSSPSPVGYSTGEKVSVVSAYGYRLVLSTGGVQSISKVSASAFSVQRIIEIFSKKKKKCVEDDDSCTDNKPWLYCYEDERGRRSFSISNLICTKIARGQNHQWRRKIATRYERIFSKDRVIRWREGIETRSLEEAKPEIRFAPKD